MGDWIMKVENAIEKEKATDEEITRRGFLVATVTAALGFSIVESARTVIAYLTPSQDQRSGGVFTLGEPKDYPPDSITLIQKGRFFLVRGADGLYALYRRCTHLGCMVPWDEAKNMFVCPCHSGQYNKLGEVIGGPPPRPLDLFHLEIVDGRVTVNTGEITQRKRYEPSQAVQV
jgi:cytochrome b6-f complex iron-sulfur subunit